MQVWSPSFCPPTVHYSTVHILTIPPPAHVHLSTTKPVRRQPMERCLRYRPFHTGMWRRITQNSKIFKTAVAQEVETRDENRHWEKKEVDAKIIRMNNTSPVWMRDCRLWGVFMLRCFEAASVSSGRQRASVLPGTSSLTITMTL